MLISRFRAVCMLLAIACGMFSSPAAAEPLTLRHAVELALKHSTGISIATADQSHAEKVLQEARAQYLPQFTVGAGLAYSNGFPLSIENLAPSLLNVTSQQYLFNAAQREFIRAARRDLAAMMKMSDDRRAQVIFETALAYAELDKFESGISILRQQEEAAGRVQKVSQQRLQVGVDSQVELTRAKLGAARVRLAMEQSRGQADLLRTRLSQLTGLPAASIETVSESIPAIPTPISDQEFVTKALSVNSAIQVANEQAAAKELRAKGEHKQLLPSVDTAMQYATLARYNNYDKFFRRDSFQRHNLTAGIVIRFPIFNAGQRAHADAADYESLKAKKEAEELQNQVTNEAIKLQQSVRQLAAARDVARLEYQLASTDVQAVQAKLEVGGATVRDQENARVAESQKYSAFLDANFELDKALMQLLRATGEIENWAMGGK